ncbi:hypothetical protein T440DRAFT_501882 [Plenodomus tracheiphilus IPT5]|uniref:Essential protein Yae1 N-terminal domain-containing protein n=1 Tax=Plenodomus tracheiphilus IPT5 TaxID=1408161 RepID=A0A6A7ASR7_9PLEO|nr:hypothetical protein T440DRAFT_501882 [Plenodomus tracheiphilus IPT5]
MTLPSTHESHQEDPFDSLLTLEDTLYTTAYTLGASDGAHAGRIEGRIFGLEKGFEKFTELGQLHGRSVIWGSRLPQLRSNASISTLATSRKPSTETKMIQDGSEDARPTHQDSTAIQHQLPNLSTNERLKNNIMLLHSLTDMLTFDTANTEEAVADFDDRVKRAGAKAKVVERIVGETAAGGVKALDASPSRGKSGPVRVTGDVVGKKEKGKGGDGSMEDFAGSRLVR